MTTQFLVTNMQVLQSLTVKIKSQKISKTQILACFTKLLLTKITNHAVFYSPSSSPPLSPSLLRRALLVSLQLDASLQQKEGEGWSQLISQQDCSHFLTVPPSTPPHCLPHWLPERKERSCDQHVIVMWSCDHHVIVMWSCDHHVTSMCHHVTIMWSSCDHHVIIMWPSVTIMWLSCDHHVTIMWLSGVTMQACQYLYQGNGMHTHTTYNIHCTHNVNVHKYIVHIPKLI